MPNIKSAKKKVRKDVKRTKQNAFYLNAIQKAMKLISKLKGGTESTSSKKALSIIDKAAKRKVIHKNKAARLKSRVMKLTSKKK